MLRTLLSAATIVLASCRKPSSTSYTCDAAVILAQRLVTLGVIMCAFDTVMRCQVAARHGVSPLAAHLGNGSGGGWSVSMTAAVKGTTFDVATASLPMADAACAVARDAILARTASLKRDQQHTLFDVGLKATQSRLLAWTVKPTDATLVFAKGMLGKCVEGWGRTGVVGDRGGDVHCRWVSGAVQVLR